MIDICHENGRHWLDQFRSLFTGKTTEDLSDQDSLVAGANALTETSDNELVSAEYIAETLKELIDNADDPLARDLIVLRSQVRTLQLGMLPNLHYL